MDGPAGPLTLSITEEAISSDKPQGGCCPLFCFWHIAAQSQCGRMSAAGESGLCIVFAQTGMDAAGRLHPEHVRERYPEQRRIGNP
jgi:hypothetical protein